MNALESFKFGFISRCIEDGLTSTQEMAQLVKSAIGLGGLGVLDSVGGLATGAMDLAKEYGPIGLGVLAAGPPIAGYMGGRMLAGGTDVDDFDVDDVKRKELINEYKTQPAKLLQEASLPNAKPVSAPGRMYF